MCQNITGIRRIPATYWLLCVCVSARTHTGSVHGIARSTGIPCVDANSDTAPSSARTSAISGRGVPRRGTYVGSKQNAAVDVANKTFDALMPVGKVSPMPASAGPEGRGGGRHLVCGGVRGEALLEEVREDLPDAHVPPQPLTHQVHRLHKGVRVSCVPCSPTRNQTINRQGHAPHAPLAFSALLR